MATFVDEVVNAIGKKALAHIDQDALAMKLYPILEKGIISSIQRSVQEGYIEEGIDDALNNLCKTKEFKTTIFQFLLKGVTSGNR